MRGELDVVGGYVMRGRNKMKVMENEIFRWLCKELTGIERDYVGYV